MFLRGLPIALLAVLLMACGEDLSSEDHLENARVLEQQQEYSAAIIELKNALQKDAGNARARTRLGKIYFLLGDFASAEKELARSIDTGVDSTTIASVYARTLLNLGEYSRLDDLSVTGLAPLGRSEVLAAQSLSQLYQGETAEAGIIMEAALQNEPAAAYARVAAARLKMAGQEYAEARQQLQLVVDEDPAYAPAWSLLGDIEAAQRNPKEAEQAYTRAIKNSNYNFDALLNRSMMRIYQNNFSGARKDLAALRANYGAIAREHPGVNFARGLVQLQAESPVDARTSFEKASEFAESYPLALYYLAAIDFEGGSSEQALVNIYRFLSLAPGSVVGIKLAARLELEQKAFERAEALLQPVVAARPDDIDALNMLASAMLGQGKSGEGLELLAKVAELQPGSAEAQARLGAGQLAAGEEEMGIATLQGILDKNPAYEQADILIVLNYLRQGNIEEAIKSAQAYRDRNPESATSYNLLGRSYLAAGEREQAKASFEKVLELRPGDPGACHGLADFELSRNDFEAARDYYGQVLKQNPDHMPTLMKNAASYAVQGKEKEMFDSLRAAEVAHPRALEPRLVKARYYIARQQLENAGSVLDGLSEEQKKNPDAMLTLASYELAAGRYNQALITLDELIGLRPGVGQYHFLKSRAFAGIGDRENSSAELEKAVQFRPNHLPSRIALTRMALLVGDTDKFEQMLAQLIELAPDNLDVKRLAAASAQQSGDDVYADELLEQVYEKSPGMGSLLALSRHRYATGNTSGAIALLVSWLKDQPGDTKVREQLAQFYSDQGQPDQAIVEYRTILALDEGNVIALNNLSWYLREKNPKESLKFAEKAYGLSPESASVLDTLAMAQLINRRFTPARRSIDRALALSPDVPELRFHDAQIAAGQGDTRRAREIVTAVLAEHEQFSERAEAEAFLKALQ